MLNFVICDDNKTILERLSKMLESIFMEQNYDAEITLKCTEPQELVNYIKENSVDVVILDINLKSNVSGLQIAEELRKFNKNFYLIFTTGHLEYALLAYQVKTFDYIPKPVTMERLENTVRRVFEDVSTNTSQTRFIRIPNKKIVIKISEVLYLKKDGMKIIYHTITANYEAYSSFSKIELTLPNNFVRCHKSYVVNVNHVKNILENKNLIVLTNDETCLIGPKYKSKLMEVLNNDRNHKQYLECFNHA